MIRALFILTCIGLASCGPDSVSLPVQPFEVTVAEYAEFTDATGYTAPGPCWSWNDTGWAWHEEASWRDPLFEQEGNHPVACVSWNDAQAYLVWRSAETGDTFRLPTEVEWEVAARAGSTGETYWVGYREDACIYANINDLSGKNFVNKVGEPCNDGYIFTSPVGTYAPNAFGLYDVQGNVWEWTSTCYDEDCTAYVLRGGAWLETPGPISIDVREWRSAGERFSFAGFRVVREAD